MQRLVEWNKFRVYGGSLILLRWRTWNDSVLWASIFPRFHEWSHPQWCREIFHRFVIRFCDVLVSVLLTLCSRFIDRRSKCCKIIMLPKMPLNPIFIEFVLKTSPKNRYCKVIIAIAFSAEFIALYNVHFIVFWSERFFQQRVTGCSYTLVSSERLRPPDDGLEVENAWCFERNKSHD